jgi:hypothetical protein
LAPVKEIGVGHTRLKEWADIDTPGWDAVTDFTITACEEFDVQLIKNKIKLVKTREYLTQFEDAVVHYMNRYYTLIKFGRHPFVI